MNSNQLSVPTWHPSFVHKPGDFIRLSATQIGVSSERVCLDNFALKSRPNTKVTNSYAPASKEQFHSFPLALVKDIYVASLNAKGLNFNSDEAADFVATDYKNIIKQTKSQIHPATIKWIDDAIAGFAKAWQDANAESTDSELKQIIDPMYFADAATPVELFAWGIFLASEDYSLREFRILKIHSAGKSELDPNRLKSILKILVHGQANSGIDYATPTEKINNIWPTPTRVRIRELAVLDGSQKLIYDSPVSDVIFDEADLFQEIEKRLAGGLQKVSTDCLKCKAQTVCPSLPTKAGVLGVINRADRPKSFSPSKLNSYLRCNHAYFLQHELALPAVPKLSTAAQERGMLIHEWLEQAHSRNIKCSKSDISPVANNESIFKILNWTQLQVEATYEYLKQHLKSCPIKNDSESVHEVDMWVMDSDAWVLVGTRPDLLYTDKNTLVWREVKTTDKKLDLSLDAYLDMYSQISLAIVLMSRVKNLPNLKPAWNELAKRRVELEIVTKEDVQVIKFDISDSEITTAAWKKLAQQADRWIEDKAFIPSQNPPCNWCAYSQWCEFAHTQLRMVEIDGVKVDVATGEILDQANATAESGQIARALGLIATMGEATDSPDDVPF